MHTEFGVAPTDAGIVRKAASELGLEIAHERRNEALAPRPGHISACFLMIRSSRVRGIFPKRARLHVRDDSYPYPGRERDRTGRRAETTADARSGSIAIQLPL